MDERRSFITVVRWPSGWSSAQAEEALVAALGMNPADARLTAARPTPLPVGVLTAPEARSAAKVLRDRRVPALAVTQDDLAALADPLRAKRLVRPMGAPAGMYLVEPWRGEGRGLVMDQVVLVVRGRVARTETTAGVNEPISTWPLTGSLSEEEIGANVAWDAADDAIFGLGQGPTKRDVGSGEIIDLWLRDDSAVRIDARRFNFDVLGEAKGLSDAQNSAQLALRLAEESPGAEVDLGFSAFRPTPGLRVRAVVRGASVTTLRDDQPLFEFYSRWRYLTVRALNMARSSKRSG